MTKYSIAFKRIGENSPFVLTSGKHFRCDTARFDRFFTRPLPDRAIDLLRIASAIYAVDRLIRRPRRNPIQNWSRAIQIQIEVLQPKFWSSKQIRGELTDALEFLTDDTWELEFIRDRRSRREHQRSLFDIKPESLVCLYSGGLDSAAGLINRIGNDPTRPVVPVTVWHQPIQRKLIGNQYEAIRKRFPVEITPLILKTALIWNSELKSRFREESSQRSRSLLFTVAGGIAAAMGEVNQVELFESGIGAINLPLMSGMTGSRATRSAHPEFLRCMSQLIGHIFDRPMTYVLPFNLQTKGQMVSGAKAAGLNEIAPMTVSCVHYPLRESNAKQCGICPACIFRRQSLFVAGLHESESTYKVDLFENAAAANRISQKDLIYLKAFLDQVFQLDAIQESKPLPLRIRRHLMGTNVLTSEEPIEPIGKLLATYRDEWKMTVAHAQGRGISWTKLLGRSASYTEGASHVVSRER